VSDTLGIQRVRSHDTILNGFNSNLESCTAGNQYKGLMKRYDNCMLLYSQQYFAFEYCTVNTVKPDMKHVSFFLTEQQIKP